MRPGSGLTSRSKRASSLEIQPTTSLTSAAAGGGTKGGGIWPVRSFSMTFSYSSRSLATDSAEVKDWRFKPPDWSALL